MKKIRRKKIKKKKRIIIFASILLLIGLGFLFYNVEFNFELQTKVSSLSESKKVNWLGEGIFDEYYELASEKLKELTLDEKIGQLLLVRYPDYNQVEVLKKYNFGGYLFFEKDFRYKSKEEVIKMISDVSEITKIPILTAVDEEGGIVVRISSNKNLVPSKFKAPRELYKLGGFDKIYEDTIEKSKILNELGINLNLAPVVDIAGNSWDYMYERAVSGDVKIGAEYAKTVILASKDTGVSYTLKHFPGYGNNKDTHVGTSVDNRSYDSIMEKDILPFKEGISAGAEAVLVSHNIVSSIDKKNPASLSSDIHKLLRGELGFTGVIITDDIAMQAAVSAKDATVKAIKAGNDIIITTDYVTSINDIKRAINNGELEMEQIDSLVFRILAWKYYKGLI